MQNKKKKTDNVKTGLGLIGIGAFLWVALLLLRHFTNKRYVVYRVIPAEYVAYFALGLGVVLLIVGLVAKNKKKAENVENTKIEGE